MFEVYRLSNENVKVSARVCVESPMKDVTKPHLLLYLRYVSKFP